MNEVDFEKALIAKATKVNPSRLRKGDEVCYITINRFTGEPEVIVGDFIKVSPDGKLVVEGVESTEDGPTLCTLWIKPEEVYLPTVQLLEAHVGLVYDGD